MLIGGKRPFSSNERPDSFDLSLLRAIFKRLAIIHIMKSAMERFLPILNTIQTRLRDILTRNERYMLSWDIAKLRDIGEDLVELARDVYPQLIQVEHRILYLSIKEAGLGIRDRATTVQKRSLEESDKEYFKNVHEALGNICGKIETDEYYKALLAVAAKREEENLVTPR